MFQMNSVAEANTSENVCENFDAVDHTHLAPAKPCETEEMHLSNKRGSPPV